MPLPIMSETSRRIPRYSAAGGWFLKLQTLLPTRAPAMADLVLGPMLGKPVMAYYYVTYKCNARCVFCNIPDGPLDVLPVSQYTPTEKSLEHFDILKKLGVRLIDFTGGEPLRRKDSAVLLRAAKERGLQIAREVFADRNYMPDGTLVSRSSPDAAAASAPTKRAPISRRQSARRSRIVQRRSSPATTATSPRARRAPSSAACRR